MSRSCCGARVNDGGGRLYKGDVRTNRLHVQDDTISNEGYIQDLGVDSLEIGGQVVTDIDDDGTMAANSDARLVTQKSIVSYVTGTAIFPHAINLYYVGKHGNDANDGLTWRDAKLTIANALLSAGAGDVVYIADAGVYTENINIATNVKVYMPNGTLTGNTTLSDGAELNVAIVTTSTGTAFQLNAASSVAHVDVHEVLCTGGSNMAVSNNGELNLHINHVEIGTGDVVAETNSDRIFAEIGTIVIKGAGADIFATSLGAQVSGTVKCIREDGGTGTLFKGSPAGTAYIDITASSINITNLSNINANAVCRLNTASLLGSLNENGAGKAYIGPPWLYKTSSITLGNGTDVNEFSIDGTMAGNSDSACPTEKAVKTYTDSHANSTGTSHTYIDQDVTSTSSPTFATPNVTQLRVGGAPATTRVVAANSSIGNCYRLYYNYPTETTKFCDIDIDANGNLRVSCQSTLKEVHFGADGFGHTSRYFSTTAGKSTVFDNATGTWDVTPVNSTTDGIHINDGYLHLSAGAQVNELSTDGTMAGDSDLALPTEKAVKAYTDAHSNSDGSSHTFINQNVTTTGTPTFASINLGDTTLSTYKQATHSASWTGIWAVDKNTTIYYTIIGNAVILNFDAITAAAVNASAPISLTGATYLPAEVRPSLEINEMLVVTDNSVQVPGSVEINPDGSVLFYVATDTNARTSFQNAGNGGTRRWSVSYTLA